MLPIIFGDAGFEYTTFRNKKEKTSIVNNKEKENLVREVVERINRKEDNATIEYAKSNKSNKTSLDKEEIKYVINEILETVIREVEKLLNKKIKELDDKMDKLIGAKEIGDIEVNRIMNIFRIKLKELGKKLEREYLKNDREDKTKKKKRLNKK